MNVTIELSKKDAEMVFKTLATIKVIAGHSAKKYGSNGCLKIGEAAEMVRQVLASHAPDVKTKHNVTAGSILDAIL